MKTVDFSKVEVALICGNKRIVDMHKQFAELIYNTIASLTEYIFAKNLYQNVVVELTEDNKMIIEEYLDDKWGLPVILRKAIENVIEG